MPTIIAGRFQQQDRARQAVQHLIEAGYRQEKISTFFVNPAGKHGTYPIGGDRNVSPGAEDAGSGAGAGVLIGGTIGAAAGAAASVVLGPAAIVAGAGVGAYVGSLQGALSGMDDARQPAEQESNTAVAEDDVPRISTPEETADELRVRTSGMLVAVVATDLDAQEEAISVLRKVGARDLEKSEGKIVNGDWVDFDPLKPVNLI